MRRASRAVLLAAALGTLSGCGGSGSQDSALIPAAGAYRGSEPPGRIPMPEFGLRDVVSGEQVSSADLRGEAVLITFVDTDCTD